MGILADDDRWAWLLKPVPRTTTLAEWGRINEAEIMRLGCEDMLASGAVITGGATQLPGMAELAEEVLAVALEREQQALTAKMKPAGASPRPPNAWKPSACMPTSTQPPAKAHTA